MKTIGINLEKLINKPVITMIDGNVLKHEHPFF